jgi:hypothetical protein
MIFIELLYDIRQILRKGWKIFQQVVITVMFALS